MKPSLLDGIERGDVEAVKLILKSVDLRRLSTQEKLDALTKSLTDPIRVKTLKHLREGRSPHRPAVEEKKSDYLSSSSGYDSEDDKTKHFYGRHIHQTKLYESLSGKNTVSPDLTDILLQHSEFDVNAADDLGDRPLHKLIRDIGDLRKLVILLEHGADIYKRNTAGLTPDKLFRNKYGGRTILHYCIEFKDADLVSRLCKKGADVNKADAQGVTCLMLAARLKKANVCEILIDRGEKCEVNRKCNLGNTALMEAAIAGSKKVIKTLMGQRSHHGENLFETHFFDHRGELVSSPLQHENASTAPSPTPQLKVKADPNILNKASNTPLHYLIHEWKRVHDLHRAASAQGKNDGDAHKRAVNDMKKREECLVLLVKLGADTHIKGDSGRSPASLFEEVHRGRTFWHLFAERGDHHGIQALLHRRHTEVDECRTLLAALGVPVKHAEDVPPKGIDKIVKKGEAWQFYQTKNEAALRARIKRFRREIDTPTTSTQIAKYREGGSPLHVAVAIDQTKIVKLLLEKGASVNILNNRKETPLYVATSVSTNFNYSVECLKVLLTTECKVPIDVNLQNEEGWSPLFKAVHDRNLAALELLCHHKANCNLPCMSGRRSPLHMAISRDSQREEEDLEEEGGGGNSKRSNQRSSKSLRKEKIDTENEFNCLFFLIRQNANIHQEDQAGVSPEELSILTYKGKTLLHLCAEHADVEAMRTLLDNTRRLAYQTCLDDIARLISEVDGQSDLQKLFASYKHEAGLAHLIEVEFPALKDILERWRTEQRPSEFLKLQDSELAATIRDVDEKIRRVHDRLQRESRNVTSKSAEIERHERALLRSLRPEQQQHGSELPTFAPHKASRDLEAAINGVISTKSLEEILARLLKWIHLSISGQIDNLNKGDHEGKTPAYWAAYKELLMKDEDEDKSRTNECLEELVIVRNCELITKTEGILSAEEKVQRAVVFTILIAIYIISIAVYLLSNNALVTTCDTAFNGILLQPYLYDFVTVFLFKISQNLVEELVIPQTDFLLFFVKQTDCYKKLRKCCSAKIRPLFNKLSCGFCCREKKVQAPGPDRRRMSWVIATKGKRYTENPLNQGKNTDSPSAQERGNTMSLTARRWESLSKRMDGNDCCSRFSAALKIWRLEKYVSASQTDPDYKGPKFWKETPYLFLYMQVAAAIISILIALAKLDLSRSPWQRYQYFYAIIVNSGVVSTVFSMLKMAIIDDREEQMLGTRLFRAIRENQCLPPPKSSENDAPGLGNLLLYLGIPFCVLVPPLFTHVLPIAFAYFWFTIPIAVITILFTTFWARFTDNNNRIKRTEAEESKTNGEELELKPLLSTKQCLRIVFCGASPRLQVYYVDLAFEVFLRFLFIFIFQSLYHYAVLLYANPTASNYSEVIVYDFHLRSQSKCFIDKASSSAIGMIQIFSFF